MQTTPFNEALYRRQLQFLFIELRIHDIGVSLKKSVKDFEMPPREGVSQDEYYAMLHDMMIDSYINAFEWDV